MKEKTNHPYVKEAVVRLTAFQVIILTSVALWMHSVFALGLLTFDFALRAFTSSSSQLAFVSKFIVQRWKLKSKDQFAPPKKFAAKIGFFLSVGLIVLLLFQVYSFFYAFGIVLIVCAFLESALNICLGCHVYSWLAHFRHPPDVVIKK